MRHSKVEAVEILVLGGTHLIGRRMVEYSFTGPINGTSAGTVSVCDVAAYVEKQTGKSMLLASDGLPGPYNGEKAYSICIKQQLSCIAPRRPSDYRPSVTWLSARCTHPKDHKTMYPNGTLFCAKFIFQLHISCFPLDGNKSLKKEHFYVIYGHSIAGQRRFR